MDSVTAGQVVLGSVRRHAKQAVEIKPVSGVPSWSLLLFLPRVLGLTSLPDGWKLYDETAFSSPSCFSKGVYAAIERNTQDEGLCPSSRAM